MPGEDLTLICPCGEWIEATTEDEMEMRAQDHLRREHPERAYTRDEILMMAMRTQSTRAEPDRCG